MLFNCFNCGVENIPQKSSSRMPHLSHAEQKHHVKQGILIAVSFSLAHEI